jgi:hypothetical protein
LATYTSTSSNTSIPRSSRRSSASGFSNSTSFGDCSSIAKFAEPGSRSFTVASKSFE